MIDDFNILGDFCLSKNGLDLNYEKCSQFIFNVLTNTKNSQEKIGKSSIDFFEYLVRDEKGPKMSATKALTEIEKTVEFGSNGFANFIQAYAFAISTQGLNYSNESSLKFAREMAIKSFKK